MLDLRIVPATSGREVLCLLGSPCPSLIWKNRNLRFNHRIDDTPCLLDIIFASKQGCVSSHGIAQEPLIGVHVACTRQSGRNQFSAGAGSLLLGVDNIRANGNRYIGADPEPAIVRSQIIVAEHRRWQAQPDYDLGAGHGQALAGSDVEGNAVPSPRIDLQFQRSERLDFRIRRHTLLTAVTAELAAHQILGFERWHGLEHLHLFVTDRFAVELHRWFHGEVCQDLKHMVLDDIANGAGRVIKAPSTLNAEILGHGDLHAFNVVAIPERLQKSIGETEEQHVVNRPLAEIMIDAENPFLVECPEQDTIEILRRGEIRSKGLLDNDARSFGAAGLPEMFYDL